MSDWFTLVCANTLQEAFDHLKEKHKDFEGFDFDGQGHAACMIYHGNAGATILFSYDEVLAHFICHEVTHATNALLTRSGIPLTDSTDEVYAYHNSMLFTFVTDFFKENKVKVKI